MPVPRDCGFDCLTTRCCGHPPPAHEMLGSLQHCSYTLSTFDSRCRPRWRPVREGLHVGPPRQVPDGPGRRHGARLSSAGGARGGRRRRHHRGPLPGGRRGRDGARPRLPRAHPALPPSRLGGARPRRDLRRRAGHPGRGLRSALGAGVVGGRDRHHQPARDRRGLGPRTAGRSGRPSCGRTGAPPAAATSCARPATCRPCGPAPASCSTRTSRPPSSPGCSTDGGLAGAGPGLAGWPWPRSTPGCCGS